LIRASEQTSEAVPAKIQMKQVN